MRFPATTRIGWGRCAVRLGVCSGRGTPKRYPWYGIFYTNNILKEFCNFPIESHPQTRISISQAFHIMIYHLWKYQVSSLLAHCGSRGLAVCPQVLHTYKLKYSFKIRCSPTHTEENSSWKILRSCQGGNTGLVGGSVPVFDEVSFGTKIISVYDCDNQVVISTGLMTNIESVDPSAGVAVCQVHPWDWETNQFTKDIYVCFWVINTQISYSGWGGSWNTGLRLGRSGDDGPSWPGGQGAEKIFVADDEMMFPGKLPYWWQCEHQCWRFALAQARYIAPHRCPYMEKMM